MPDKKVIGARLQRRREELGISRNEMAKKLGIGRQNIFHYESGLRIPGDDLKIQIADILHMDLIDIFFADEVNQKFTSRER